VTTAAVLTALATRRSNMLGTMYSSFSSSSEISLERYEYATVRHLRGVLSQQLASLPAAFERAQYVRAISGSQG
jgi:hypothetical protein